MGKIIVIEGTDSSGKETQTNLLYERISKEYDKVKKISFPNYESPASEPIKMYLAGQFGENPKEVSPYPVSTMYAIDRFASFKTEWEDLYRDGYIIITDRYVSSNMIHQASKISEKSEKEIYLDWLEDLEYNKMGIPKPDATIFLNMPFEVSMELIKNRKNKITGEHVKDIHERDVNYMKFSYENALDIAKKYNWIEINCVLEKELKTREAISDEIYKKVIKIIEG